MQEWPLDVERCAVALGEPAQSYQALVTLPGLMRRSRLPTLLAWGPELRLLYNEPFAPVLGTRHLNDRVNRRRAPRAPGAAGTGRVVERAGLAGQRALHRRSHGAPGTSVRAVPSAATRCQDRCSLSR